MTTPEELSRLCDQVATTADALQARPREEVIGALVRAAGLLRKAPPSTLSPLIRSSGLSGPMVAWGLRTTMKTVTKAALRAVLEEVHQEASGRSIVPARLGAVVLAGNLFTAALRPVWLHLLLGCPVVVKTASREPTFPVLLREAIHSVDEPLSRSFGIARFQGGNRPLEAAFFEKAECISLFGADETLDAIVSRRRPDQALLRHGHGLGIAYVAAPALREPGPCARALALDVAAYDQRGCLSPQIVFVQRGGPTSPRDFAARLALEALPAVCRELPRGPLPEEISAAQSQWRGVSRAIGELFEGDGFSVSYEPDSSPRLSPGYRNVAIAQVDGWAELLHRISPFSSHVKCFGIAGHDAPRLPAWAASARLCALGTMQTPPFELAIEGRAPWSGIVGFEPELRHR